MDNKKYFITFEGIDGSGKDSQIHKLGELIKEDENGFYGDKYSNIWITREPTKITPSGKEISRLLRTSKISKEDASRLFVQDRVEHTNLIRDFLNHSDVLCSRYDLSTLTYQYSQGMDFDELYSMHGYGKPDGALIPDITILFDLTAEEAAKRTAKRDSEKEFFEELEFQQKVRDNTYWCINRLRQYDGRRIIVINADQSIEDVTKEMYQKLKPILV